MRRFGVRIPTGSQLRIIKPRYHRDSGVLVFYCAYPCAYILFISDFTLTKNGRRFRWERGVKDAQGLSVSEQTSPNPKVRIVLQL